MRQDKFMVFTSENAMSQIHIDLDRHFFAGPKVEEAERAKYEAALMDFESLQGKVTASADNLLRSLQYFDEIQVRFMRHYTCSYLRYAINTNDTASATHSSTLNAEYTQRTAFLQLELMNLDQPALDEFIRQEPALKAYLFIIESARRYHAHMPSLQQEETIRRLSPFVAGWQFELYQEILQRTSFRSVKTEAGELNPRSQRAALAIHPDRQVRKAGFKEFYAGFASQRDLYAFTLIEVVKARNLLAQLHQFEDAPAEVYFNSYWSKADVTDLLGRIGGHSDIYKRYQRLRANHVKKQLNYHSVHPWDISANLIGESLPRFTFEQASGIIRAALAPLGPEYGRELAQLLDPANGRLDILPGNNRKSGGFSRGFPGVTTVFFMGGFEGYYNDMRVLMHESTHAIHRQLMNNKHVLPAYASGPHYLFESFAIFHELLLPDFLYQKETDLSRRRYYIEQFFEGKGMAMFFVAQDAALEQAIFDGVAQGTLVDANSLDLLAKQVNARYSIWSDNCAELNMRWMTNSLFYEDPLYEINYVYGSLLALRYYEMFERDREWFIQRYIELMGHGFDAPPAVLLDRFLNIDLNNTGPLIAGAVQLLERKLQLLETLYLE